MRVDDLMTKQVFSCRPEDSLEHAAQLMWDHDCGCLPVCAGASNGAGKTIGVITDRDICMNALFREDRCESCASAMRWPRKFGHAGRTHRWHRPRR